MNASCDRTLETSWAFVRDNWRAICDQPEDVEGLRQGILSLAFSGCLTSRKSQDGDAEELFAEISRFHEELIRQKKVKNNNSLKSPEEEEFPFLLPDNWQWLRIGQVADLISGKGFKAEEYSDSGIRLCQIANVTFGATKWEIVNYLPSDYLDKYPDLSLGVGDVLIALNRPLLKGRIKVAILRDSDTPSILYQRVGKFLLFGNCICNRYFFYYLQSRLFIDYLNSKLQGSDQPFINKSNLVFFLFPLPPLAEQKRIVAKVDELMKLCDQLEESLRQQQRLAESLTAAAMSHLSA